MVERYGGAGGFGGITSDRTDQRQGPHWPHRNVSKFENYSTDEVQAFCFDCGQRWTYSRSDPWGAGPGTCVRGAA